MIDRRQTLRQTEHRVTDSRLLEAARIRRPDERVGSALSTSLTKDLALGSTSLATIPESKYKLAAY
jgi:hypothetical protein